MEINNINVYGTFSVADVINMGAKIAQLKIIAQLV
jgi:hypothetical protein